MGHISSSEQASCYFGTAETIAAAGGFHTVSFSLMRAIQNSDPPSVVADVSSAPCLTSAALSGRADKEQGFSLHPVFQQQLQGAVTSRCKACPLTAVPPALMRQQSCLDNP